MTIVTAEGLEKKGGASLQPPSFAGEGHQSITAPEGTDVNISVDLATNSGAPAEICWRRGEHELILGDRHRVLQQNNSVQLHVQRLTKEDAGSYTLTARNVAGEARRTVELRVEDGGPDIPVFLRRLSDLAVKVGTRTRFLVEIRSSVDIKVTWYHEDEPIIEADRFHLLHEGNFFCVDVAPVTVEDGGRWTCMAEAPSGRASCSSYLNVLVPKAYKAPEFLEELQALLTEQGTVSLECKVIGVPTPVLHWYKDGKEIKAGDVFALTANPDDPTSLGTYTCEAVNCMGKAYSSSRVHVMGKGSREGSLKPADNLSPAGPPPIFRQELKNEKIKIGDTVTLSCQVAVPPWPQSITWYNKAGRVEEGERYHIMADGLGGYMIEIRQAEAVDEGEWKCVATSNEGVRGISKCNLSVTYPKNYRKPRFLESLKAILTDEGLVSFECKVVGFPTPVLRWFKDGQELKPGDVYQLTGTNSLGSYSCIAKNCMGEATSCAELTVEDIQNQLNEEERLQLFSGNQPPHFIQGLKSQEARINEQFRFTVQVSISPEPSVSWYRDDEQLEDSDRYVMSRETLGYCHLDIRALEIIDQAEWKCVASNEFGHSVTSCFLKLIIPRHYKKPRFLECLRAILSEEGAVNLECKVIGVPQPVLKWYKDGVELKPGDIHRIISGQDGTCCLGTYTCEAHNCMGTVASSASLLGFEDRLMKAPKLPGDSQPLASAGLARNPSLSTIHEERTSQMYDTPATEKSERGEVSFSFDGKEVSVSLYETPDLTEEEALQVVEMYADQLSEHVSEHNVVELPPLRFVKESSKSGPLQMEAVVVDVTHDAFASAAEEDLRTDADLEEFSITDDGGQAAPPLPLDEEPLVPHREAPKPPPRRRGESGDTFHSISPIKVKDSDTFYSISPSKGARSPEEEKSEHFTDAVAHSSELDSLSKIESFSTARGSSGTKEEARAFQIAAIEEQVSTKSSPAELVRNTEIETKRKKAHSPPPEEEIKEESIDKAKGEQPPRAGSLKKKIRSVESGLGRSFDESDKEKPPERPARRGSRGTKERSVESGQGISFEESGDERTSSEASSSAPRVERRKKKLSKEDVASVEAHMKKITDQLEKEEGQEGAKIAKPGEIKRSVKQRRQMSTTEVQTEGTMREKKETRRTVSLEEGPSERVHKQRGISASSVDLPTLHATSERSSGSEKVEASVVESLTRSLQDIQKALASVEEQVKLQSGAEPGSAKSSLSVLEALSQPIQDSLAKVEERKISASEERAPTDILETISQPIQEFQKSLALVEQQIVVEKGEESLLEKTSVSILENVAQPVQELQRDIAILERQHSYGAPQEYRENEPIQSAVQTIAQSIQMLQHGIEILAQQNALENKKDKKLKENDAIILETLSHPLHELRRGLEEVESKVAKEFNKESKTVKIGQTLLQAVAQPLQKLQRGIETVEQQTLMEAEASQELTRSSALKAIAVPVQELHQTLATIGKAYVIETAPPNQLPGVFPVLESLCNSVNELQHSVKSLENLNVLKQKAESGVHEVSKLHTVLSLMQPLEELHKSLTNLEVAKFKANAEHLQEVETKPSLQILAKPLSAFQKQLKKVEKQLLQGSSEKLASESSNVGTVQGLLQPVKALQSSIKVIQEQAELPTGKEHLETLEILTDPLQVFSQALVHIEQEAVLETASKLAPEDKSFASAKVLKQTVQDLRQAIVTIEKQNILIGKGESGVEIVSKLADISQPLSELQQGIVEAIENVALETVKQIPSDVTHIQALQSIVAPLEKLERQLLTSEQKLVFQLQKAAVTETMNIQTVKSLITPVQDLQKKIREVKNNISEESSNEKCLQVLEKLNKPIQKLQMAVTTVAPKECSILVLDNMAQTVEALQRGVSAIAKQAVVEAKLDLQKVALTKLNVLIPPLKELHKELHLVEQKIQFESEEQLSTEVNSISTLRALAHPLQELQRGLIQVEQTALEPDAKPLTQRTAEILVERILQLQRGIRLVQQQTEAMVSDSKSFTILENLAQPLSELQRGLSAVEEHNVLVLEDTPIFEKASSLNTLEKVTQSIHELQKNIASIEKKIMSEYSPDKPEVVALKEISKPLIELEKRFTQAEEMIFDPGEEQLPDKTEIATLEKLVKPVQELSKNLEKVEQSLILGTSQKFTPVTLQNLARPIQALQSNIALIQNQISTETCEEMREERSFLKTLAEPLQHLNKGLAVIEEQAVIEPLETLVQMPPALQNLAQSIEDIHTGIAMIEQQAIYGGEESLSEKTALSILETMANPLKELQKSLARVEHQILLEALEQPKLESARMSLLGSLAQPVRELQKGIALIEQQAVLEPSALPMREAAAVTIVKALAQPIQEIRQGLATFQQVALEARAEPLLLKTDFSALKTLAKPMQQLQKCIALVEHHAVMEPAAEPLSRKIEISRLQTLAQPLKELHKSLVQIEQQLALEGGESISEMGGVSVLGTIAKPVHELVKGIVTIQNQVTLEAQAEEVPETQAVSMLKTIATPLQELQKCLAHIEEQVFLEAPKESLSQKLDISILKTLAQPIKEIQRSILTIEQQAVYEPSAEAMTEMFNVSALKTVAQPLQKLHRNLLQIQQQLILEAGEKSISGMEEFSALRTIAKPVQELVKCIATIQKQVALEAQEKEISEAQAASMLKTLATPLHELQNGLAEIEQQVLLEAPQELMSQKTDISVLKALAQPIKDIQRSIVTIQHPAAYEPVSELSNVSALRTFAQPLQELHKNLIQIQQQLTLEAGEKSNSDAGEISVLQTIAKPVHELMKGIASIQKQVALEVHAEISERSAVSILKTIANPLQELQRGLAQIEQQILLEGPQEQLSQTMNISMLKTLAQPIQEIQRGILTIEQQDVYEPSAEPMSELSNISAFKTVARPLQELHENLLQIQEQLTLEAGDKSISKMEGNSVLETVAKPVQELLMGIATIQNQVTLEGQEDISETQALSMLKTIASPLQELQKGLAQVEQQVLLEPPQEPLSQKTNISILKTLAQPIKEIQRGILTIEEHAVYEPLAEPMSELSTISALQTLAQPLQQLHENLLQIEQQLVMEAKEEVMPEASISALKSLAKPIHEVQRSIALVQQQALLEAREEEMSDKTTLSMLQTLAHPIQELQRGIAQVEQQVALEVREEEMSEKTGISILKTLAKPIHELNREIALIQENLIIEPPLESFSDKTAVSMLQTLAQPIQELLRGIAEVQHEPTFEQFGEEMSEKENVSVLKTLAQPIQDLKKGLTRIEQVVFETGAEKTVGERASALEALAKPIQELQSSIAVIEKHALLEAEEMKELIDVNLLKTLALPLQELQKGLVQFEHHEILEAVAEPLSEDATNLSDLPTLASTTDVSGDFGLVDVEEQLVLEGELETLSDKTDPLIIASIAIAGHVPPYDRAVAQQESALQEEHFSEILPSPGGKTLTATITQDSGRESAIIVDHTIMQAQRKVQAQETKEHEAEGIAKEEEVGKQRQNDTKPKEEEEEISKTEEKMKLLQKKEKDVTEFEKETKQKEKYKQQTEYDMKVKEQENLMKQEENRQTEEENATNEEKEKWRVHKGEEDKTAEQIKEKKQKETQKEKALEEHKDSKKLKDAMINKHKEFEKQKDNKEAVSDSKQDKYVNKKEKEEQQHKKELEKVSKEDGAEIKTTKDLQHSREVKESTTMEQEEKKMEVETLDRERDDQIKPKEKQQMKAEKEKGLKKTEDAEVKISFDSGEHEKNQSQTSIKSKKEGNKIEKVAEKIKEEERQERMTESKLQMQEEKHKETNLKKEKEEERVRKETEFKKKGGEIPKAVELKKEEERTVSMGLERKESEEKAELKTLEEKRTKNKEEKELEVKHNEENEVKKEEEWQSREEELKKKEREQSKIIDMKSKRKEEDKKETNTEFKVKEEDLKTKREENQIQLEKKEAEERKYQEMKTNEVERKIQEEEVKHEGVKARGTDELIKKEAEAKQTDAKLKEKELERKEKEVELKNKEDGGKMVEEAELKNNEGIKKNDAVVKQEEEKDKKKHEVNLKKKGEEEAQREEVDLKKEVERKKKEKEEEEQKKEIELKVKEKEQRNKRNEQLEKNKEEETEQKEAELIKTEVEGEKKTNTEIIQKEAEKKEQMDIKKKEEKMKKEADLKKKEQKEEKEKKEKEVDLKKKEEEAKKKTDVELKYKEPEEKQKNQMELNKRKEDEGKKETETKLKRKEMEEKEEVIKREQDKEEKKNSVDLKLKNAEEKKIKDVEQDKEKEEEGKKSKLEMRKEEKEEKKNETELKKKEDEEKKPREAKLKRKEEEEKQKKAAVLKPNEKEYNNNEIELKSKEVEEKKIRETELQKKEEEEKQKNEAELKNKEAEAKKKAEADIKEDMEEKQEKKIKLKRKEEEEKDKKEAELKNKELAQNLKKEEEEKKKEMELKRKEEEEKQKRDENLRKKKEEENKEKEADLKKKEEEEKKKRDAELKQKEGEEKKNKMQLKMQVEEEKRKTEASLKMKKEEEKKKIEAEFKMMENEEKKQKEIEQKKKEEEEKKKDSELKEKEAEEVKKKEIELKEQLEKEKNKMAVQLKKKEEEEKEKLEAKLKVKEDEVIKQKEAERKKKEEEENKKNVVLKPKEAEEKKEKDIELKNKEEKEKNKMGAELKTKEEEEKDEKGAELKNKADKGKIEAELKKKDEQKNKQDSKLKKKELEEKKQKEDEEILKTNTELKHKKQEEKKKGEIELKTKKEEEKNKIELKKKEEESKKKEAELKEKIEKEKIEAELITKDEERNKKDGELKREEVEGKKQQQAELEEKQQEEKDERKTDAEFKQEAEKKRKMEIELKKKEDKDEKQRDAEFKNQEDEERKKKEGQMKKSEDEEKKGKEEQELKKKQEEIILKKGAELKQKQAEELLKKETELEKKEDEEKKLKEAELKIKQEGRKRKEAELKKKEGEEKNHVKAEEEKKSIEELKRKKEEQKQREIELKRKEEEEKTKMKAELKITEEKEKKKQETELKKKTEEEKQQKEAEEEEERKKKEAKLQIREQEKLQKKQSGQKKKEERKKNEDELKKKEEQALKRKENGEKEKQETDIKPKEDEDEEKKKADIKEKKFEGKKTETEKLNKVDTLFSQVDKSKKENEEWKEQLPEKHLTQKDKKAQIEIMEGPGVKAEKINSTEKNYDVRKLRKGSVSRTEIEKNEDIQENISQTIEVEHPKGFREDVLIDEKSEIQYKKKKKEEANLRVKEANKSGVNENEHNADQLESKERLEWEDKKRKRSPEEGIGRRREPTKRSQSFDTRPWTETEEQSHRRVFDDSVDSDITWSASTTTSSTLTPTKGLISMEDVPADAFTSTRRLVIREKVESGPRDARKKPVFASRLTDRTAAQGSRIKLTCAVVGTPDPAVSWLRDGLPLDTNSPRYKTRLDDGLASLEILSAAPSDSGEYTCVARNLHGENSSSATLKVFGGFEPAPSPPTFTRAIKELYRYGDDELTLECRVRSHPPARVTWLKDGKDLPASSRYTQSEVGDGICRLVISQPDPHTDNGQYTCRAENAVWSDQISTTVQFSGREQYATTRRTRTSMARSATRDSRRPHFSSVLTDHQVPAGGTIALQVEVKGAPKLDVSWLRGEEPVQVTGPRMRAFEESGVYTLMMAEATEKEAGVYTCRVRNAFGQIDTKASVQIVPVSGIRGGKPAMFLSRPDPDLSITVGEDITVSFRVTGSPKPKVTWMKGLRDITNSQRSLKETMDDYVRLTLKRALLTDAGTYCILAKNVYGCDRAFITVMIRQRARSLTPSLDWGCTSTENILRDIKDDMEIAKIKDVPGPVGGEPVVVDSGRNWLTLSWPKCEQKGGAPVLAYRVEAWTLGGEGGARWVEMGVSPISSFDAFNLKPGCEYKFRVTPKNRYGWGESVTTSEPISVGRRIELPEFTKILPGQLKALKGSSITLECQVRGDPAPEVRWFRDSTLIPSNMTQFDGAKCRLVLDDLQEEHSGRYMCEATNKVGRVSTFARLFVVNDPKILEADFKLKRGIQEEDLSTEIPPQFTMRLRDRRVQMTYPVRLTCQVAGRPSPQITWSKDGEEIKQDDRHTFWSEDSFHTLELSRANLEDSGCYSVTASNAHGAVSCRCHLVVDKGIRAYVAPDFIFELEPEYKVREGGELRLFAQVEAYPTVGVMWHRDGVRLRPSRSVIMTLDHEGSVELALAGVTARDAGVYTCTATNEVGRAETTTRVIVETVETSSHSRPPQILGPEIPYSKEPRFVTKPRSTEAVEGDTVIILCEVVGDPKPEVVWLRDWLKPDYYRDAPHFRRVGEGPGYRLEIPRAKLDYTGAYSVIARNCHGEAKAVISLQIYAKGQGKEDGMERSSVKHGRVETLPVIRDELKDLRCCDGDAVTLECRVHATPPPEIRWEKGGRLLPLGGDFSTEFDGETARLHIHQVYPEDEGEYSCVAHNDLGRAITSACLIVDVPEEKETLLSRQLSRPAGLLSAGSTPRSTPRTTPSRSKSPSISRFRESSPDTGGSRPIRRLKVAPPKFYAVPHNRVAEEGETVRFQCAIAGHPTPWVTWDKDGLLVTPSARLTLSERDDLRVLEISEVTTEDAGFYRVTLENEVGRVEASARLEVIGRYGSRSRGVRAWSASPRTSPTFGRRLIGSAARIGNRITLACDIRGSPAPGTTWYRDGELIVRSSRIAPSWDGRTARLDLEDLQAEDAGVYTCVAENELGRTRCSARLVILEEDDPSDEDRKPPVFIQGLSRTAMAADGGAAELQVRLQGTPPLDVVWMKDGVEIPDCEDFRYVDHGDGRFALRIADVFPQDAGEYRCEAYNLYGDDVTTGLLTVTECCSIGSEEPVQFDKRPCPVVASPGSSASFCARLQRRRGLKFCWLLGGRSIPVESPRFKVEEEGEESILHISGVEPGDAGLVTCLAVNSEQQVEASCSAELSVLPCDEPPAMDGTPAMLVRGPADTTAHRGDTLVLRAAYVGDPPPLIRWLRAGRELNSGGRISITTEDGESCLTIQRITADDSGKYVVSVENILGADCHFASVAVEGPPDPPAGRPTVSENSSTSVNLAWSSAPYDGGCMVTGYRIEMRRQQDNEWQVVADRCHSLSHIVRNLTAGEAYVFRVRAENVHGLSEASNESEPFRIGPEEEAVIPPAFEPRLVEIAPGEQFRAGYDVQEELGKGRYGVVHKVRERRTGATFAAKFVRCIKAKDREKVREEIDIMNMLHHPKLLQLAAAFESPREVVMVMEYISGGELFERVVADDFTLTERDCILFMRQICEGVDYMHQNYVVHLDLKPENIMCHTRTSHQIKLIDFGLAQKLDPDKPVRVLFGTPEFIPPEIINYEPIGVESDMWSVGVICYVLLSGLSPFMGDNDAETFANITRADYDFDDEAFDAISQDAKDFISALLVKRKEKRLTARECLEHTWLAQHDENMSCVRLCTDKLKKFIIRRKWQKTGNAIRALGRMATLSAASRRNSNASSTSGSPRPSLSGIGSCSSSVSRMSSLNEEDNFSLTPEGSSPPVVNANTPHQLNGFGKDCGSSETKSNRMRICSERSDSGISDCSSIATPTPPTNCQCPTQILLSKKFSITEEATTETGNTKPNKVTIQTVNKSPEKMETLTEQKLTQGSVKARTQKLISGLNGGNITPNSNKSNLINLSKSTSSSPAKCKKTDSLKQQTSIDSGVNEDLVRTGSPPSGRREQFKEGRDSKKVAITTGFVQARSKVLSEAMTQKEQKPKSSTYKGASPTRRPPPIPTSNEHSTSYQKAMAFWKR